MQYINITPDFYVERNSCLEIFNHLRDKFDDSISLCVRNWDNENNFNNKKRIVIVTSAEGHKYIPSDQLDPNCLAVFMHYYPKLDTQYQFSSSFFLNVPKVFPLPLGSTSFFKCPIVKNYHDRMYDFSFIGQLDPYRRMPFYHAVMNIRDKYNCFVQFYDGWNNGVGGEKYSQILSDSKIALVPFGSASLDTFRFYEAAESGCILLTDRQNNYPFMEKSTHIVCEWGKLEIYLDNILRSNAASDMSNSTRLFWEKYLSPEACAKYIISKVIE